LYQRLRFFPLETVKSERQDFPIASKRGIDLSLFRLVLAGVPESLRNNLHGKNHEGSIPFTSRTVSKNVSKGVVTV